MDNVGALEEAARKRKERLQALKRKQNNREDEPHDGPETKVQSLDDTAEEETSAGSKKNAIFKNYIPEDESLQEKVQPNVELAQVEEHIQEQLQAAKPEPVVEEIDLNNLAPRKPDWDLKRDVAKKLAKLDKRTQRAIAELIRDRLQSGEGDLVTAVQASSEAAQQDDEDSD
ncbi:coiled-coil domain-containing protein 12-like [Apostichopus japonicus]|uniref:coiled-coil domain-containing protein 12-like n=1 Tax=Stichopus japonicus TaxID=307972 RepID=UPI003AB5EC56